MKAVFAMIMGATLLSAVLAITPEQCQQITHTSFLPEKEYCQNYVYHINLALHYAEVFYDCPRQAAFLAYVIYQTSYYQILDDYSSIENLDYRNFDDELGNNQEGDGIRYHIRGALRYMAGRRMYTEYGKALGVDFEKNPDLAGRPEWAFKVAAHQWKTSGANKLADQNTALAFRQISQPLFNCTKTLDYCEMGALALGLWEKAKQVLNCKEKQGQYMFHCCRTPHYVGLFEQIFL
eukprot:TRINITY_DN1571_c0_g4_i1.p2 TRINITY_DN1571_c0_g4~~TRINITY_DN1571_c0_g4_i1.p2  ORF type:complete len:236 (+),score=42.38 TRINITY_DN1571_c0_g4_i1:183-890(+)